MHPHDAYKKTPAELVLCLKRAGWKQMAIADRAETTQATISRILSGRHKHPRYDVVERLRDAVVELDEFQPVA
ncbi:helix-turn-helix domain-containing protein [Burkholderia aenigmatica]|uniref:helix-turn-helix domain-containing protein n=1 Tax=Burkholderia aenigmatica TaxID=2015348 RepID=UPI0026532DF0|nr:helix-turn-helix transcriptional regulator [Burkholderia aenigmatica]MDN7881412.1 helix-turn-helix transcriptional regulator [Burkholderia aenigmatica]